MDIDALCEELVDAGWTVRSTEGVWSASLATFNGRVNVVMEVAFRRQDAILVMNGDCQMSPQMRRGLAAVCACYGEPDEQDRTAPGHGIGRGDDHR